MTNPGTPGRSPVAKIIGASLIGTTVEWYDFFLYSSASAVVFNKLFFPMTNALTGTLLALLTYALGFVARPAGGLVFGHFGDRIGRKKLLVISLLMMGLATCAMGVLPTYASIGLAAPALLTVLRLVQGFALGGEWGGAVLIVSEHGSDRRRGLWASWPQTGVPAGNILATAVLVLLSTFQSDAVFDAWGWRLPFLLSGVLVAVGLWLRLTVTESPVFLAAKAASDTVAHTIPLRALLRTNRREVLLTIGARMGENVSYYLITAFILVYVTTGLGLPKSVGLTAVFVASIAHFAALPLFGMLSDRVGRKPVYLAGLLGMAGWAFAFFALLNTRSTVDVILATTVGLVLHAAMYGPQPAFFAELFPTPVRYTGLSVSSQVSSIIAGAVAPLIAVALLQATGSTLPIVGYLVAMCAVSVLAVCRTPETRGTPLHPGPAAAPEAPPVEAFPVGSIGGNGSR